VYTADALVGVMNEQFNPVMRMKGLIFNKYCSLYLKTVILRSPV
jgi:hypothetical protein